MTTIEKLHRLRAEADLKCSDCGETFHSEEKMQALGFNPAEGFNHGESCPRCQFEQGRMAAGVLMQRINIRPGGGD